MPFNKHFKQLWLDRSYPQETASAEASPPPPEGFRRLYHLTSADHAVSNVVFQRIKATRISETNDPFEMLSPNGKDWKLRKLLREHKKDVNELMALVCFSGDWRNPLLWSHYAARHRGIALGFDVEEALIVKVEYAEARVDIGSKTDTVDKVLSEKLLRTKYISWEYEQEYRMIVELAELEEQAGLYFARLSKGLVLREIVLGELCPLSLNQMRDLAKKFCVGANTFRARQAHKTFGIVPDGNTVLRIP